MTLTAIHPHDQPAAGLAPLTWDSDRGAALLCPNRASHGYQDGLADSATDTLRDSQQPEAREVLLTLTEALAGNEHALATLTKRSLGSAAQVRRTYASSYWRAAIVAYHYGYHDGRRVGCYTCGERLEYDQLAQPLRRKSGALLGYACSYCAGLASYAADDTALHRVLERGAHAPGVHYPSPRQGVSTSPPRT